MKIPKRCTVSMAGGILCLCAALDVAAYEEDTHSLLTGLAINRSVLSRNPSVITRLGLPETQSLVLTTSKGDVVDTPAAIRFGSRWEDGYYEKIALNHFFDPQYDGRRGRGLQLPLININGQPSPLWALEDTGPAPDSNAPGGVHGFSMRNAQQALFKALTLPSSGERLKEASRMYQTLGHVVHHIQDMGQPQHVRNDQHYHPIPHVPLNPIWAAYEVYAATQHARITSLVEASSYANPKLPTFRDYWTSAGATPKYVGMAEFTAQNFTSFGTAYVPNGLGVKAHPQFPLPDGMNRDGSEKRVALERRTVTLVGGVTVPAWSAVLRGDIYDGHTNHVHERRRLAKLSLATRMIPVPAAALIPGFTEDDEIYNDYFEILLPRAVAFSAGLIDKVFAETIELRATTNPNVWEVRNVGTEPIAGQVSLYYESDGSVRQMLQNAEYTISLAPSTSTTVSLQQLPPSGTRRMIAAFRGRVGIEGSADLSTGYYIVKGHVVDYVPPAPSVACAGPFLSDGTTRRMGSVNVTQNFYSTTVESTLELGTTEGSRSVHVAFGLPFGLFYQMDKPTYDRWLSSPFQNCINGSCSTSYPAGPLQYQVRVTAANGAGTLLSSKTVGSGVNEFRFDFDSSQLGTTKVVVKETYPWYQYRATAESMPEEIVKQVSCPGGSVNPNAGLVGVSVYERLPAGQYCNTNFKLYLDNVQVANGVSVRVPAGRHWAYADVEYNSNPLSGCQYRTWHYRDSRGEHAVPQNGAIDVQ